MLDLRQLLLGAGFGQTGGQFFEAGFEAGDEARGDRGFLGLAALGMTVKPDFRAVLAEHALQADGFVRRGQGVDRVIRVEFPAAFAADHEVAVALFFEPGDVGGGGDPGVHDDQGAFWRGETFEHVRQ